MKKDDIVGPQLTLPIAQAARARIQELQAKIAVRGEGPSAPAAETSAPPGGRFEMKVSVDIILCTIYHTNRIVILWVCLTRPIGVDLVIICSIYIYNLSFYIHYKYSLHP